MRFYLRIGVVLCSICFALPLGSRPPITGFEDVLKGDEPAKPYHFLFPFFIGDAKNILGTIVFARRPGKVEAFYEGIDSPKFRTPGSDFKFESDHKDLSGGTFSSTTDIGAALSFAQIDALYKGLKKTDQDSKNLLAKVCDQSVPTPSVPENSTKNGESDNSSTQTSDKKTSGATKSTSKEPANDGCEQSDMTSTGVSLSKFSGGSVTITGAHMVFYTLATIAALDDAASTPLNKFAQQQLKKESRGWIVARAIVADSVTYNLKTKLDVDAGLFAQITRWFPSFSAKIKDSHTIAVSTSVPIIVGYKLWRPGEGAVPSSTGGEIGETLDAEGIDGVFQGKN